MRRFSSRSASSCGHEPPETFERGAAELVGPSRHAVKEARQQQPALTPRRSSSPARCRARSRRCRRPRPLRRCGSSTGTRDVVEEARVHPPAAHHAHGLDRHAGRRRRSISSIDRPRAPDGLGVGAHEGEDPVGEVGARGPQLRAVDDVAVARRAPPWCAARTCRCPPRARSTRRRRTTCRRRSAGRCSAASASGPLRTSIHPIASLISTPYIGRPAESSSSWRMKRSVGVAARTPSTGQPTPTQPRSSELRVERAGVALGVERLALGAERRVRRPRP